MRIIVESIPRSQMRYDTEGDWFLRGKVLYIQVPDDLPPDEAWLIAMHEMVEVKLCHEAGITEKQVDDFDFAFEGEGEPGEAPGCPYAVQHRDAMIIESALATMLGVRGYSVMGDAPCTS